MMELSRVRHVVLYYDNLLKAQCVGVAEHPDVSLIDLGKRIIGARSWDPVRETALQHLRSTIERLVTMIEAEPERREKIMRWYGFIQGALWMGGYFTVRQLKDHSRPDAPLPV